MISEKAKFEGEDPESGLAAPGLDLLAAGFLIFVSVLVMVASLTLPVPNTIMTAPGLLPFITAASLCLMAIMLANSALKRRRAGVVMNPADARDRQEDLRALALAGAVALYILALQVLAFQVYFSVFGIGVILSAFQPVTVIALASIIHISWRGPFWITVSISLFWTCLLSVVFQKLFQIPLPGGF